MAGGILIKVTFTKEQWGSVENFAKNGTNEIKLAIRKGLSLIHGQIIRNISGPSHTRFPGNGNPFPGVLTGRMKQSVHAKIKTRTDYIRGVTGPNTSYAAKQNEMRPFIKPAWEKVRKKVRQIIRSHIQGALKNARHRR